MRFDLRTYLQPAFVICVLVLMLGGVVMSKFYIEKEPWPLKKPLALLDEDGLGAYRVVKKLTIEDEDVLTQLGTEDYIQWLLEDSEELNDSPVRNIMFFVTYYPLADRVPHVPEECYVGAGHQLLASEEVEYTVVHNGGEENIAGTHLIFQRNAGNYWGFGEKFSAFYLFSVNGGYAGSRNSARLALNKSVFSKHCYFSKVEWSFSTGSGTGSYLDEAEARKAGEKLLAVILPVLESKHWPKEGDERAGEELLDESEVID